MIRTAHESRANSARHNKEFISEVVWKNITTENWTEQDIKNGMLNFLPVFNSYHIWSFLAEKYLYIDISAINIVLRYFWLCWLIERNSALESSHQFCSRLHSDVFSPWAD